MLPNKALKTEAGNPFPGLRSFEIDEAGYFFGREDEIYDLLDRLKRTRFLGVVGASGCGKSSLIKAGLIATLQGGYMVENGVPWKFAVMRPWQDPIGELVQALGDPEVLDITSSPSENTLVDLESTLRKGSLGIIESLKKWQLPENNKLLILVDQFEELFTFMKSSDGAKDEARAFVKLLLEAALQTDYPIYLALTMRSEFLGNCVDLPGLPEFINAGLYLLPQMDREQLRDVIKLPIETVYQDEAYHADGSYPDPDYQLITESLVDTMLNELPAEDPLPLLQHALMRTWDEWRVSNEEKIAVEHYNRVGGLEAALSNHVDEVYKKDLDDDQKKIAETIFRGITVALEGDNIVRNKLKIEEIYKLMPGEEKGKIDRVIEKFAADRRSFIVLSGKDTFSKRELTPPYLRGTNVDVSHESLIRQWKVLQNWANDEALIQEIHKQISKNALLWKRWNRNDKYLYQGKLLIEANEWYKKNSDKLTELETEFITTSVSNYENELFSKPQKELAERIIQEGGSRSETIEKGDAYVFFCYARENSAIVRRLGRKLEAAGGVRVADWKILASTEYSSQVTTSIQEADAFVFFISRESVVAPFCLDELGQAVELNKRIVPVVLETVDSDLVPAKLKNYQWITFGKDKLDGVIISLAKAIKSDLYWVQAHSRLLVQATEWKKNDREKSMLLLGRALEEGEELLSMENPDPPLTSLQLQYIQASRDHINREQSRRSKAIAAGFAMIGILFLSAAVLAFVAREQARSAVNEANRAVNAEREATTQKEQAETQRRFAEAETERARIAAEDADEQRRNAQLEEQKAIRASDETKKQKERAERERLIAEQARAKAKDAEANAIEQARLAKEQEIEAVRARDSAKKSEREAEEQRIIADQRTQDAVKAQADAEKYKEVLKARSLSLMAEQLAPNPNASINPEASVLFATESLKTLQLINKYPAESNADQALQRGLAALPLISSNPNQKPVKIISHNGHVSAAIFTGDEGFWSGGEDGILKLTEIDGQKKAEIDTQGPIAKILFTDHFALVQHKGKRVSLLLDLPDELLLDIPDVAPVPNRLILNKSNENTIWKRFDFTSDITDSAVDKQGELIAVAYDSSVQIIRRVKGNIFIKERVFQHDTDRLVSSVNFSPDGKYVVTADGDEAWIWDVESGRKFSNTRQTADGQVKYAVFNPNGNEIATISKDNKVRIWSFYSGSETTREPKPGVLKFETSKFEAPVDTAKFSVNGNYFAVAAGGISAIYVTRGQDPRSQSGPQWTSRILGPTDIRNAVTDINFSSDSRYVITSRFDGTVSLWAVSDGKLQTEIKNGKSVNTVSLDPGGRYVLTTSPDGVARVWDITSGWDISKPIPYTGQVSSIAFNQKSHLLAIAGKDKAIILRDIKTGELKYSLPVPANTVTSAVFNLTGSQLITGGSDGAVLIWDPTNSTPKRLPTSGNQSVDSVSLAPDGIRLVVAGLGHGTEIWNISNREKIGNIPNGPSSAFKASFNPGNSSEIAAAYFDHKLRFWELGADLKPQMPRWEKSFDRPLSDIAFSPNGRFLAVALEAEIKILNVNDGSEVMLEGSITFSEVARNVLAWSEDGNALAVGNKSKAEVWDVKGLYELTTPRKVRKVVRIFHNDDRSNFTSLVFSQDISGGKSYLVTGATNGTVRLWLWRPEDLIKDACSKVTRNLSESEWRNAQIDDKDAPLTCPN